MFVLLIRHKNICIVVLDLIIKRGIIGIPLTHLAPPHGFPTPYVVVFSILNNLR